MGFLVVFIGAGLGGMLRHAIGLLSLRWLGPGFPYGTLFINIAGSAAMGLVVGLLALHNLPNQNLRLFLATGILGGFTTFSTFSLDSIALWQRGQMLAAAVYVVSSVAVSFLALWGAMAFLRR